MGLSEQDRALIERVIPGLSAKDSFYRVVRDFPSALSALLNAARAEATEAQAWRIGALEEAINAALHELRAPWPGDGCVNRASNILIATRDKPLRDVLADALLLTNIKERES